MIMLHCWYNLTKFWFLHHLANTQGCGWVLDRSTHPPCLVKHFTGERLLKRCFHGTQIIIIKNNNVHFYFILHTKTEKRHYSEWKANMIYILWSLIPKFYLITIAIITIIVMIHRPGQRRWARDKQPFQNVNSGWQESHLCYNIVQVKMRI